jgi:hypothetical protein
VLRGSRLAAQVNAFISSTWQNKSIFGPVTRSTASFLLEATLPAFALWWPATLAILFSFFLHFASYFSAVFLFEKSQLARAKSQAHTRQRRSTNTTKRFMKWFDNVTAHIGSEVNPH